MSNTADSKSRDGTAQDCVKSWDDELIKVSNALKLKEAETNKAKKVLDNAKSWAAVLETYWKNIDKTNTLCREASLEVKRFKGTLKGENEQSGICDYTRSTAEVTEALYCLVEAFYTQTDSLKTKLSALLTRIDCLNNPAINPKSSKIYACLKELSAKLDAAIASQKETIKLMLDVVKSANILHVTICSREYGLRDKLEDLLCLLHTQGSVGEQEEQRPRAAYGRGCEAERESCSEVIDPVPVMPLDKGAEDSYYHTIRRQAKAAEEEKDEAEKDYEELRKERDSLRSSKKSLENAKQASEAAKGCK